MFINDTKWLIVFLGVVMALGPISSGVSLADEWKLPPLEPGYRYGNIILDRTSTKNKVKPAVFSHWIHRRKFSCRVCHSELGFVMKAGVTPITEAGNQQGKFCGSCHNGAISFKLEKNCERCHNGNIDYSRKRFAELNDLPKSGFADVINWVKAEDDKLIKPAAWLKTKSEDMPFTKEFVLRAEWNFVPPSVFSHKIHTQYLDCNNCHPDTFNIQKKGTKDFTMSAMLGGEFCGSCHLNVAFPLHDCKRCHPGMTMW